MYVKDADILEIVSPTSSPRGHGHKMKSVPPRFRVVVIVNNSVRLDFVRSEKSCVGPEICKGRALDIENLDRALADLKLRKAQLNARNSGSS